MRQQPPPLSRPTTTLTVQRSFLIPGVPHCLCASSHTTNVLGDLCCPLSSAESNPSSLEVLPGIASSSPRLFSIPRILHYLYTSSHTTHVLGGLCCPLSSAESDPFSLTVLPGTASSSPRLSSIPHIIHHLCAPSHTTHVLGDLRCSLPPADSEDVVHWCLHFLQVLPLHLQLSFSIPNTSDCLHPILRPQWPLLLLQSEDVAHCCPVPPGAALNLPFDDFHRYIPTATSSPGLIPHPSTAPRNHWIGREGHLLILPSPHGTSTASHVSRDTFERSANPMPPLIDHALR